MSNRYIPHTDEDIKLMLERIGVDSVEDLYADVPREVLFKDDYALPEGMSEIELREWFGKLGAKNRRLTVFGGQGAYDHYSPSVIPHLLARSEFYTAYTPYQPEISQGTLQYIFEYQSMISELTGLEATNASMYDGATAAAETAFMMVAAARKRNAVLMSATLNPRMADVVRTYMHFHGVELREIPERDGVTDLDALREMAAEPDVAGAILPQPNKYGIIEDLTGVADALHANKALLSMVCDPSTLAVLRSPAEWGADIACGDGQSLGMPLQFGGPYLGYISTTKALLRKMPGRVVGATTDDNGNRCYVLTLQAREQHIRREKATSNICSNQSLMALYATIYMALMGTRGLREVNTLSANGAHLLCRRLEETGRFKLAFDRPFLKEFTMRTDLDIDAVNRRLADAGIMGGVKVGEDLVAFAVTERRTVEEIERLITLMLED